MELKNEGKRSLISHHTILFNHNPTNITISPHYCINIAREMSRNESNKQVMLILGQ